MDTFNLEKDSYDFFPICEEKSDFPFDLKNEYLIERTFVNSLTSYITNKTYSELVKICIKFFKINKIHNDFNNFDNQFDCNKTDSDYCNFNIFFSKDPKNEENIIVEFYKIEGDGLYFSYLYQTFGDFLENTYEEIDLISEVIEEQSDNSVNDEKLEESKILILHFKNMSQDIYLEARIEAAKMACTLLKDKIFIELMLNNGCVEIIINFLNDEDFYLKTFAVIALEILSENEDCQEKIISSGVVSELFSNIYDGHCNVREKNHRSTRLLANISNNPSLKDRFVEQIGLEILQNFQLDSLSKDPILYNEATRLLNPIL